MPATILPRPRADRLHRGQRSPRIRTASACDEPPRRKKTQRLGRRFTAGRPSPGKFLFQHRTLGRRRAAARAGVELRSASSADAAPARCGSPVSARAPFSVSSAKLPARAADAIAAPTAYVLSPDRIRFLLRSLPQKPPHGPCCSEQAARYDTTTSLQPLS